MKPEGTVLDRPERDEEFLPMSSRRPSRRPPAWTVFLVVMAPLLLIYRFLPTALAYSLMYDVFAALSFAAVLIGVRINKPEARLPWYLLAAGIGLWLVGDLMWTYFEYVVHTAPFPSAADALYIAAYAFFASGIYLIVRRQTPSRDRSLLIDAGIITIVAGVLAWVFLMAPYAHDPGLSMMEKLVSIAYPVGDVVILSVLIRALLGARRPGSAHVLLACGLLLTIASDTLYSLMLLNGNYAAGHVVDFGWLMFYVLWGTAALHPSMATRLRPSTPRRHVATRLRLWVMGTVALVLPTVAIFERSSEHAGTLVIIRAASVAIFILVIWKMGSLLTRLQSAHEQVRRMEQEKGRLLDRTMQVGEEERVRIAKELHDGPIQQLSAAAYRFEAGLLQLQRGDHASAAIALGKVQGSFHHEIEALREMMRALRPPALEQRGLGTALRDLLSAAEQSFGFRTSLRIRVDERLPHEIETGLFRITQQALANVADHGRAQNVRVELSDHAEGVLFSIEDDGVGFDTSHQPADLADGQFGLIAMRQHVEALGGTFAIASSSTGTLVQARFENRPSTDARTGTHLIGTS
jgi:signal transduction histidine kinase